MSYPKVLLSCCLMALSSQVTAAEFQHCELPTDTSSFEFVSDSSKLVALSLKNAPTDGLEEVFYDVHATEPDHIYLVNIDRHAREIAKHVYQDYTHFYYNEDRGGTLIVSKYPINPNQILPNRALAQPLEIETSAGLLLAHVMCLRPEIVLAKGSVSISANGEKKEDDKEELDVQMGVRWKSDNNKVEVEASGSFDTNGKLKNKVGASYESEDSRLKLRGSIQTEKNYKKDKDDENSTQIQASLDYEF